MSKLISEDEIKRYFYTLSVPDLMKQRANLRLQKRITFGGPDLKTTNVLLDCVNVVLKEKEKEKYRIK